MMSVPALSTELDKGNPLNFETMKFHYSLNQLFTFLSTARPKECFMFNLHSLYTHTYIPGLLVLFLLLLIVSVVFVWASQTEQFCYFDS